MKTQRFLSLRASLVLLLLTCGFSGAFAQLSNPGFETGNFASWSTTSNSSVGGSTAVAVSTGTWTINPAGSYQARVEPADIGISQAELNLGLAPGSLLTYNNSLFSPTTNWGTLTQTLTLGANQTIVMYWNYVSSDYIPYNDGIMATLVGPSYESIKVLAVTDNAYGSGALATGSYGSTGWFAVSFTSGAAGTYRLGFAAFNCFDQILNPVMFIDNGLGGTSNPGEPVVISSGYNVDNCTDVTLSANVTSDGNTPVTARGFVYNTTGSATLSDNVVTSGSGTGAYSATLSGLTPGTTYYVRSYATNSINTAYGSEFVINTDGVAPVPDLATLPTITGGCSAITVPAPTATDNCAGPLTATTTDPTTYSLPGNYTITWVYNDGNGNSTSQTQTVIMGVDNLAPVPDAASLPTVTGDCSAAVTGAPTATDNCAGTINGTTTDPLTYNTQGTFTITWTFDDGHGNTSTQPQTVIVDDNVAPTASTPSSVSACDGASAGNSYTLTSVSGDNCNVASFGWVATNASSTVIGSGTGGTATMNFPVGVTTITWTATDDAANSTSASATVTIWGLPSVSIGDVSTFCKLNTIYIGYGPTSLTLTANGSGGTAPYQYSWTTPPVVYSPLNTKVVSPATTTTYTVYVKDANGCTGSSSATKTVAVKDVRCGNKNDKVAICHVTGSGTQAICVAPSAVPDHLSHGDCLGNCSSIFARTAPVEGITVYPNPATGTINVTFTETGAGYTSYQITDVSGRTVLTAQLKDALQHGTISIDISSLARGMYIIRANSDEGSVIAKFTVK